MEVLLQTYHFEQKIYIPNIFSIVSGIKYIFAIYIPSASKSTLNLKIWSYFYFLHLELLNVDYHYTNVALARE